MPKARISQRALERCIESLAKLNSILIDDYEKTAKSLSKLSEGHKDQNFTIFSQEFAKSQKQIQDLANDIEEKRKIVDGPVQDAFIEHLRAKGLLN